LIDFGLILKYMVRGDDYLLIVNFSKTQVISRKTTSILPSPAGEEV